MGPELLASIKELDYRLTVEPAEWGESREYLPVLQLEVRFGVAGVVTVWYAVDVVARCTSSASGRAPGPDSSW